ncbi:MAG TPA: hypothetical protein VFS97_03570 [Nitrososphaeraceae archaeon]|nr:hypothetical protein [Nitrososphaeraceae archaeon]
MSTAIYDKFPDRRQEIWKLISECIQGIRLITQIMKSAIDDRYKRSLTEWVTITKYAKETSPEAASKKFYGITPDGKKLRLSQTYKRQDRGDKQLFRQVRRIYSQSSPEYKNT